MLKKIFHRLFGAKPEPLPDVSKSQWYTRNEIKSYQEERLQKLIRYACKTIPYYKNLFKQNNLHPKDIRNLDDLKKIPILTRKKAIENYNMLVNPALINFTHHSGATTGQRLEWVSSRPWAELFTATLWRGFNWAGLTPDLRVVSFYSRVIGEITKNSLIIREAYDKDKIHDDLERIQQFQPQYGYCYASAAYIMAQHLIKHGMRLPLKGFITTSDQLYQHYRETIEEAFQCKVYNNYGCNDGGSWGAECPFRKGLHHDFERNIIEFDEKGKMIATDLWNYAMPLIRYENGDSGQWLNEQCPCGRQMPLLSIEGRTDDYIITPTQVFSPTAIDVMVRQNKSLEDLQIVQQSEHQIEIFFVPKKNYSLDDVQESLTPFTQHLKEMHVVFTEQDKIIRPSSNKKRLCLNHSRATIDKFFSMQ